MSRNYSAVYLGVVVLALGFVDAGASGQETAAEPAAESFQQPDTNASGRANAAFQEKFDEYKRALREIEKLNVEYQSADEATRKKINEQLTGQVAHAQ